MLNEADAKFSKLLRALKANMQDANAARQLFTAVKRTKGMMTVRVKNIQHRVEYWHDDGSIRTAVSMFYLSGGIKTHRHNHSSWNDLISADPKATVEIL